MSAVRLAALALTLLVLSSIPVRVAVVVDLVRVPDGGLQPEVVIDDRGTVHLAYLAGAPAAADVYYVRSTDGARTFSAAIRVNSQPGSAIATGTIRGAQIAVGRDGRIHVAWNGSDAAEPKPPVNPKTNRAGMPMLYARSDPGRRAFEPQRNLITRTTHLDGGGSIAADRRGGVFVAWHAHPASGEGGEDARRVWIARSVDDGRTFDREAPVAGDRTGACGCCALRLAAAPDDSLHLLYRSATNMVNRDIHSLVSRDRGLTFAGSKLHPWNIGACPMTSMSIAAGRQGVLRAWETDGQVYFTLPGDETPRSPTGVVSDATRRKHPRVAVNAQGSTLLAWTEGTSWGRGGSVAWQAYAPDGSELEVRGSRPGVPVWGFAAVVARPDGGFTVLY